MSHRFIHKKGQALVLVTLALFAMCGLMGLAVDMGWSMYVEKTEQAAADAASLAAVLEALAIGGQKGPYSPGSSRAVVTGGNTYNVTLSSNTIQPVGCPANPTVTANMNNLLVACLHAKKHGFQRSNTRQNVTVELGDTSPPPLVPGVETEYWATVRIAERIPQLFSAVLGNTEGLVASVSTAGLVDSVVIGSLLLINRDGDELNIIGSPQADPGLNLVMGGGGTMDISGGIIIASSARSGDTYTQNNYAAEITGSSTVFSQFINIRGPGEWREQGTADFAPDPTTGHADGGMFLDPMRGKGQPYLYDPTGATPQLMKYGVPGGTMNAAFMNGGIFPPGIYFATEQVGGVWQATGRPLNFQGDISFMTNNDAANPNSTFGFGRYIFVGGVESQGGNANISLAPGQYVFAGAGNGSDHVLDFSANPIVDDHQTPNVKPSNAGEMFIFAGPKYPQVANLLNMGLAGNASAVALNLTTAYQSMGYGGADIKAGNKPGVIVNLHGLNGDHADFPSYLKGFESVMMWQDQDNSLVDYDWENNTGNIKCSGNFSIACPNPDRSIPGETDETKLELGANQYFSVWGVLYQPRGAFTHIQAAGTDIGALQLVTGAMRMQGNGTLNLGILSDPIKRKVAALIR